MSSTGPSSPNVASIFDEDAVNFEAEAVLTPASSIASLDLDLPIHKLDPDQTTKTAQSSPGKQRSEFSNIQSKCPVLSPTGCTRDFCQAGRAIHTFETRVGRDRPIQELKDEALAFLQECGTAGIIETVEDLEHRTRQALSEIGEGLPEGKLITADGLRTIGQSGANWEQTRGELEFGLKLAWRNSRKCIMRSEYAGLKLCDLRHVKTSRGMAEALSVNLSRAYNQGKITPTVFVFPPREPGKRGPQIWNEQLLAFAGYRRKDGSILGDPKNIDLTESIIGLGWQPLPENERTPWDILPIVTMADDDVPSIMQLPDVLKQVVTISHPRYEREFKDLGLKWVAFPALSRLGFDIGGVQYTATPFIGWFMDAEIGVRNLADPFRYNALPKIVAALKLSDEPGSNFEDLAEYKRLAALSRAQTELTYAVHHSFLKAKISMTDTLTASMKWCQFDDAYLEEHGYRLPADPYWLAPPQGSIVPLWHRGGAPNYQPKPMICRHVQDPVKAWHREKKSKHNFHTTLHCPYSPSYSKENARSAHDGHVRIYYCSSGVTAAKLCRRLFENLSDHLKDNQSKLVVEQPKPLNHMEPETVTGEDYILVIASSTGHGEVPLNGEEFLKRCTAAKHNKGTKFSVYGNGDSTYKDTFNKGAAMIRDAMSSLGFLSAGMDLFEGDTALSNPDWDSFRSWTSMLKQVLLGKEHNVSFDVIRPNSGEKTRSKQVISGRLVKKSSAKHGIMQATIDVGTTGYNEMDHLKILPPNSKQDARRAMEYLRIGKADRIQSANIDAYSFFTHYIDLSLPFKTLNWLSRIDHLRKRPNVAVLSTKPCIAVLQELQDTYFGDKMLNEICADMPSITPRVFSAASSPAAAPPGEENHIDVLVKWNEGGRFSHRFLRQAETGATMRMTVARSNAWEVISSQPVHAPLIALVTGSGIAPLRSLLRNRLATRRHKSLLEKSICLFAGYKSTDEAIVQEVIAPAMDRHMFDICELVASNADKRRPQDKMLVSNIRAQLRKHLQHPNCMVFVCANSTASEATASNLSDILGGDVRDLLGERYIEEVFKY